MGKPLPPIMGGKQSTTPSPAPASGSTGATSTSSGGGLSGKNGYIPTWIMTLGIAYLVIRGLFIIGRNYITIFDWVIIAILAFFAILSFWNGKNRWLSLVLIVAIGCIIWFNQYHIDSFKTQPTEQSAGQEQVATAPATVEEIPSTERMVWGGEKIVLTGDGEYLLPKGKKSLCITALGMKDGSSRYPQNIDIGGTLYSELGSGCKALNPDLSGKIIVDFSPGKPWGTKAAILNIYKEYDSKPGGIGQLPFIAIGM